MCAHRLNDGSVDICEVCDASFANYKLTVIRPGQGQTHWPVRVCWGCREAILSRHWGRRGVRLAAEPDYDFCPF